MGFGAYLSWKHCGWFTEEQCTRVCKLINDLELSLWHEIMNDKEIFHASTKKMIEKRGGNLAAPLPRGEIGECGYLNDITDAQLSKYVDEYREFVTSGSFARAGRGVEPLLEDVGLGDTSHDAISHVRAEIAHGLKNVHLNCDHIKGAEEEKKDGEVADGRNESYQDWIKKAQEDRNSDWKMNVGFVKSADTETAITFPQNTLFYDGAEEYAMSQTSIVSTNIQAAAKVTMEEGLFAPCMVGSLESQFLKMFARTAKAKRILDVGTFTGMSAIAFAEGALRHTPTAQIHTLESDAVTAEAAAKIFSMCEPSVSKAIQLHHCDAIEWMRSTASDPNGLSFDIIFIDADKDNYLAYYEYAMGDREGFRPLLSKDGIILADNTLSALVYDDDDSRRTALHLFNQHVKNDARVEQAVMTVREGVSIIIRV